MGQDFGTWYDAKEQFKSAALEERVKRLAGRRQKPAVPKPQDLLPGGLSSKAAEVSNAANADPALTVTSARQADPHTAEGFMANVDRMLYGEATSGYGKAQNDPYRAAVRIQVMQALEQADKFGGLTPGLARKLSLKIAQDVKSGFSSDKRAAQRADDFARAYSGVPDARSEFLKAAPAAMVGTPVSDPGSPEPLRPLDADEAAVQSPPPDFAGAKARAADWAQRAARSGWTLPFTGAGELVSHLTNPGGIEAVRQGLVNDLEKRVGRPLTDQERRGVEHEISGYLTSLGNAATGVLTGGSAAAATALMAPGIGETVQTLLDPRATDDDRRGALVNGAVMAALPLVHIGAGKVLGAVKGARAGRAKTPKVSTPGTTAPTVSETAPVLKQEPAVQAAEGVKEPKTGEPITADVYHATDKTFSQFDLTKAGTGLGETDHPSAWFHSNPKWAEMVSERFVSKQGRVMPSTVEFKNPLVIDAKDYARRVSYTQDQAFTVDGHKLYDIKWFKNIALRDAIDGGHDGLIIKNGYDLIPIEGDVYAATDASAIRPPASPLDPPSQAAGGTVKEPWQMTNADVIAMVDKEINPSLKQSLGSGDDVYGQALELRTNAVHQAIRDGKQVPQAVLDEMPSGFVEYAKKFEVPTARGRDRFKRVVQEPSATPEAPQTGAQGPKTASLNEAEGTEPPSSVIEHGSGFDPRPAVETALNRGPSGKVHSSAGARFRNFFIENLTDLTKADETGAVLARRLGSADAKAQVLTREAVAEIDRAAGRRGAADDLFKALVESRLRGARDRWTAMGETDNAANVASVLSDAEFQRITNEPWFPKALEKYKETMEPALADVHSLNGGVFSDSLGPLDTYYPLTRLDEGGLLPGPKGTGRAMSAPANLRNKMATGLGKDYDTSAAGLAQAMRHMVRSNTKAALIARLKEAGLVTEVPEGSTFHAPGAFEYGGVEYQGRVVPTGRGTQQVFMPEWLARELDPVIGTSGDLSPKAYAKAVNAVNTFALAGPMDAAFHANNLMGVLTSGTPVLPGGVIGNVPLVKRVNAVFQVLKTVPSKDPLLFDKLKELADVGALPTKAMSQTYSRRFAQATGAKFSPASFGPLLYGPNGLDVRARLIMRDVIRSIKPDATPKEVGDFVNQLGAYNKALEATAERRLKQAGIAPFATAGKTMLLQSLRAVTGTTVLPKTTFAKAAAMRSAQQLSSGTVGTVTLWALLYNGATGKWPWEDKGSRLGMVPVPESWEQNPVVKAMATGKKGRAEIDVVRLAAPLVARGFRATGARGAYDAGAAGGDTDQMFDAAVAGMFNSALHPLMSGPIPHAAFTAATGKEPYLLGLRDRRAAFSPSLIDAGPDVGGGIGQAKSNLTMGALAVNPFTMDVAKAVFPSLRSKYEDEQEKAQGASPMDRAASTLVELAFAPTVSRNNKGSVFMSRGRIGFLYDQRKAAKKVRSERGRIDASQGESK